MLENPHDMGNALRRGCQIQLNREFGSITVPESRSESGLILELSGEQCLEPLGWLSSNTFLVVFRVADLQGSAFILLVPGPRKMRARSFIGAV